MEIYLDVALIGNWGIIGRRIEEDAEEYSKSQHEVYSKFQFSFHKIWPITINKNGQIQISFHKIWQKIRRK